MIDLRPYIDGPTRLVIAEMYAVYQWQFEPSWIWPFADVCALHFRVCRNAEALEDAAVAVALSIRAAIYDYMEDEFA